MTDSSSTSPKHTKRKWYSKNLNQIPLGEPSKQEDKWRDASPSDSERGKEAHKTKDGERKAGYACPAIRFSVAVANGAAGRPLVRGSFLNLLKRRGHGCGGL